MKISKLVAVILAAVIFVSGSAWAGEGCGKTEGQKKNKTCHKEDKDKKCKDPNSVKDPNSAGCKKKAETPAAK